MKKHFILQRRCKLKKDKKYYKERIKNLSLRIKYLKEIKKSGGFLTGRDYTYSKTIRQLESARRKNIQNLKELE